MNQDQVLQSIPAHLRPFCVQQHYDMYTPQDHAVWRYIMHRNMHALRLYAHPSYVDGLEKTGINIDRIPDINEMNERLGKIGWRAVVVDGFVPPAAFMEFQEHKILVISAEMRNINNVLYTPAPDIVHEAAGHAPIIAEPKYAEFLQRVGVYGAKAVFSKLDYELYEAIRYLSIIKEYPDATADEITKAEADMLNAIERNTNPSEAALLSRFHWWTVEYGLMGSPENFTIYGAGILSSVGESKACLDAKVKKIPLTVDCVNFNYDITEMQPQLFVARDFDHLIEVLEEFASLMCFRVGGPQSVKKLIETENVGTCELNSGLQISGVYTSMETDLDGNIAWIATTGQSQLAFENEELPCHGIQYHNDGYSTIVGTLVDSDKCLSEFSEADLILANIQKGQQIDLNYTNGYSVSGTLKNILRRDGKIILLTISAAILTDPSGKIKEAEDDGLLNLSVGSTITSVFSGSADRIKFNVYPPPSTKTTMKVQHKQPTIKLFTLYDKVAQLRLLDKADRLELEHIHSALHAYPKEWLLRLELLEICSGNHIEPLSSTIRIELLTLAEQSMELNDLIRSGLEMLGYQSELVY